ncbi:MAG: ARMT1-like domain-containing protein, partial [Rhodospirillales bacterium]|nr:ARMT1-like domain-containing protein [Rhodospirillales bacterium]
IADPYRLAKQRESEQALKLLPALLARLDTLEGDALIDTIVRGVFAGNIFDLGATRTVAMFEEGKPFDFDTVLDQIKPRPWLVDDYDALLARLRGEPYEGALLFVDNAGPDVLLGMIPFARWLLQAGTRVVLTANTTPSLNDITHEELLMLLEWIVPMDGTLAQAMTDSRLTCVPSGNGAPLIDLSRISPELAAACEGIDLVVLEGMGRAVESNLNAKLTCDCLKICMLKDEDVAVSLGGQVFDVVLKFEQV